MSTSDTLPSVLLGRRKDSSISIERSLNQIRTLLLEYPLEISEEKEARIHASIDDIDTMLKAIER